MLSLAQYYLVPLGIALLIGVAAGRWAFARRAAPAEPEPKDGSDA